MSNPRGYVDWRLIGPLSGVDLKLADELAVTISS
ncbi:MAG: hypothetical protein QOC78_276 [Solirubrobacteraceae bacterium]|nr:hypothetical protein [Solirubrobacteraceae bacterium]